MDGEHILSRNPYEQMDDLGVLTHNFRKHLYMEVWLEDHVPFFFMDEGCSWNQPIFQIWNQGVVDVDIFKKS